MVPVVDIATALSCALGTMMALYERKTSGVGQEVGASLLQTALFGDVLVAAGERHGLERDERDLLRILESEPDDRADLVIIDTVHERGNENDVDAGFVQGAPKAAANFVKLAKEGFYDDVIPPTREERFVITPASEIMAILALAESRSDLRRRTADRRGEEPDALADATTANFYRLFDRARAGAR